MEIQDKDDSQQGNKTIHKTVMFDKPYRQLQIGEMFELYGHGLSIKLTANDALDLLSGQVYPLNFNKKVSQASSLQFSHRLFLAQRQGIPVICNKINGGFECSRFLITKTEFVRESSELQGVPYGADDTVDIMLTDLTKHLKNAVTVSEYLSSRRERQL